MSANILSPEERQQLTTIPTETDDAELVRFFTLRPTDMLLVDLCGRPGHRLDQVAHICILRWLGWSPVSIDWLPQTSLVALCEQLHMEAPHAPLMPSPARTSRLHAQRARECLGWRKYTAALEHSVMAEYCIRSRYGISRDLAESVLLCRWGEIWYTNSVSMP